MCAACGAQYFGYYEITVACSTPIAVTPHILHMEYESSGRRSFSSERISLVFLYLVTHDVSMNVPEIGRLRNKETCQEATIVYLRGRLASSEADLAVTQ